jgi:hypothetical protein
MKFHKNVTEEEKLCLEESLAKYKSEKPMTLDEKSELHKWVEFGGSPYDNGYGYCFENGNQMDFIEAERINIELYYQNRTKI